MAISQKLRIKKVTNGSPWLRFRSSPSWITFQMFLFPCVIIGKVLNPILFATHLSSIMSPACLIHQKFTNHQISKISDSAKILATKINVNLTLKLFIKHKLRTRIKLLNFHNKTFLYVCFLFDDMGCCKIPFYEKIFSRKKLPSGSVNPNVTLKIQSKEDLTRI